MLTRDYSDDDIPNEDINTLLGKVGNMLISTANRCFKKGKIVKKNETVIEKECRFKKH